MSAQWKYQMRIYLDGDLAEAARFDPGSQKLKWLSSVLAKHRAKLRCQFDLFAEYVAEAERVGTEDYHLYEWTKATIEDPAKRAKYVESFSLYVDDQEVYAKEIADALETDLMPLAESGRRSGSISIPHPPSTPVPARFFSRESTTAPSRTVQRRSAWIRNSSSPSTTAAAHMQP